jgi:transcriptional regulator GlxA family with amidase domain
MLHGRGAVDSPFHPVVVNRDGQPMTVANGVRLTPDVSFAQCPRPDVVCVTDLLLAPRPLAPGQFDPEVAWLRQAWEHGATLASSCSGALLLAATGLLDGHDATSHWAYCDHLSQTYPRTRWHADRGLVLTGPGQRLVMAGSGVAWHMLVLALIARHASPEEAMQVARINLFDMNDTSPLAYASLTRGGRADDPLIARCQLWAADHYRVESPVAQMAALSGLPERTFKRRFALATGMGPLEYVHTLRVEEAKQLLETTDWPVEAVAVEVGYQDASFFTRLFRRQVSLTPAQYRRRFAPLDRQLRLAAANPAPA